MKKILLTTILALSTITVGRANIAPKYKSCPGVCKSSIPIDSVFCGRMTCFNYLYPRDGGIGNN